MNAIYKEKKCLLIRENGTGGEDTRRVERGDGCMHKRVAQVMVQANQSCHRSSRSAVTVAGLHSQWRRRGKV